MIFFLLFFVVPLNMVATEAKSFDKLLVDRSIDREHAALFSRILTLDNEGRIKPFHTIASEILRKTSREKQLYNQNPSQIVLGMMIDPLLWQMIPLIKVSDNDILKILKREGSLISFVSFFHDGKYILTPYVESAYSKKPIDRTKFDKNILKVDERVNICSMVFLDNLINIFPNEDGHWTSDMSMSIPGVDSLKTQSFKNVYRDLVYSTLDGENSWKEANLLLNFIQEKQKAYVPSILPSDFKIDVEILYNNLNPFGWNRLFIVYFLSGILLLITLLYNIFYSNLLIDYIYMFFKILIYSSFSFHILALIMRWYVSGHAPWSNAYESVIFIAFATMVAGITFSRKSLFTLPAACLVTSMLLVVANLNWLDPEMTNLVPVLKSYWLMIHVSVITSSYGFFGLCAFLGFFNMILIIFKMDKIEKQIKELTIINEQSMMLGLFLLTIGTFLGGVWANESWGRYWGWDPKETWALVSCIVYTVILHIRLLKSKYYNYLFNFFSLFCFSTILMTYFGVNYYLDGLHSYAAGDAFPIPTFILPTLVVLVLISIISFFRFNIRFNIK